VGTSQSAVALLSSGLDSSVALAMAIADGYEVVLALTFDYGQKAATREILHAGWLCDYFKIPHRTLKVPFLAEAKKSGLLKGDSSSTLPAPNLKELDNPDFLKKSSEAVWVPNRNGVFIEIASCLAEQLSANHVIVGFNREEAMTFPDNSDSYREAINHALSFSTANRVKVISPTSPLNKIEIVKVARTLQFPLDLIWSCYDDVSKMCGKCESCMRLKRALNQNKVNLDAYFTDPHL
jgi:7-cyano-7-deazaguanine synthase